MSGRSLRICIVAASAHPVREPYAGGLEAMTALLARSLTRRGHRVTLFAGAGSDVGEDVQTMIAAPFAPSDVAQQDVNAVAHDWIVEHHAYLDLMLGLARDAHARFDVVHNNSIHHLPVAMAGLVPVPVVTTLHTPPLAWLESAAALAATESTFVAVSQHTSRAWSHAVASTVILNGVDTHAWQRGDGGRYAVWTGRLVREKAPHLAIEACRRAGVPLVLAGPAPDLAYFSAEVAPRLGGGARYAGHLRQGELVSLVGGAGVAVVTPQWEEPYGLVAAEALSCGTPVAAFARGGLTEVIRPDVGSLVAPDDVDALAVAVQEASRRDRAAVRRYAQAHLSVDAMTTRYEATYEQLLEDAA